MIFTLAWAFTLTFSLDFKILPKDLNFEWTQEENKDKDKESGMRKYESESESESESETRPD